MLKAIEKTSCKAKKITKKTFDNICTGWQYKILTSCCEIFDQVKAAFNLFSVYTVQEVHRKKRFSIFPSPAGMSLIPKPP